jgi:hypothetical protein
MPSSLTIVAALFLRATFRQEVLEVVVWGVENATVRLRSEVSTIAAFANAWVLG